MDITVDLTQTVLETARLRLRPWRESDLDAFYAYASVPGVGEMAGWPHHTNIEGSRVILKKFMDGKNEFAIAEKESDLAIGSLGMHESWANAREEYANLRMKEIGYVLSKDYWGRALMPEAVRAVIRYCFEDLRLDALTITHSEENARSGRVIAKCGFVYQETDDFYLKLIDKHERRMKYILLKP